MEFVNRIFREISERFYNHSLLNEFSQRVKYFNDVIVKGDKVSVNRYIWQVLYSRTFQRAGFLPTSPAEGEAGGLGQRPLGRHLPPDGSLITLMNGQGLRQMPQGECRLAKCNSQSGPLARGAGVNSFSSKTRRSKKKKKNRRREGEKDAKCHRDL